MKSIFFVASARDYHAMDWYRIVKRLCPQRKVAVVTDLIVGEGFEKIVNADDEVVLLFPTDKALFSDQSRLGNLWRNIVKLAVVPILALRLKALSRAHDEPIFHAHSMYYIFLCWIARVEFIATPMGSDVLVRPDHSRVYRCFTIKALRSAASITVDSVALQEKIFQLCGVPSVIIQNGIDAEKTKPCRESVNNRSRVLSMRGFDPNYRILDLVRARNQAKVKMKLDFIYPFYERNYRDLVKAKLYDSDEDYGRVGKNHMYQLFSESLIAISIPISDSSPRSVYESIFCGCCVAVSPGKWLEALPSCMKSRIFIVDIMSPTWFDDALIFARNVCSIPFVPSTEAIQAYDENEAMKSVCRKFYGEVLA